MADVLLIKNLNEDQLNSKSLIPVTFQTNISDKDKLVNIFNVLKDKKLVENKKLGIKKSSITLELFSSNITEVIKELIKNDFMIYGVYGRISNQQTEPTYPGLHPINPQKSLDVRTFLWYSKRANGRA